MNKLAKALLALAVLAAVVVGANAQGNRPAAAGGSSGGGCNDECTGWSSYVRTEINPPDLCPTDPNAKCETEFCFIFTKPDTCGLSYIEIPWPYPANPIVRSPLTSVSRGANGGCQGLGGTPPGYIRVEAGGDYKGDSSGIRICIYLPGYYPDHPDSLYDTGKYFRVHAGQCCREVGGATVKIPKLGAPGYLPDCGQCESTGCTVTGSCVAQGSVPDTPITTECYLEDKNCGKTTCYVDSSCKQTVPCIPPTSPVDGLTTTTPPACVARCDETADPVQQGDCTVKCTTDSSGCVIKCKDVDKPTVDFGEYSNADCYVTPGACVCSADPSDTEICAGRCAGTGRKKRGFFGH